MGITEKLVNFVLGFDLNKVSAEAIYRAKELILDTIGVTLAGSASPMGEIVHRYVRHVGGNPQATIIGRKGLKTSCPNAAMANGANAAMLDYDDNSWVTIGHPSGVTVPTVLALGEELGTSGRDIIEAYIAAYEAGARIAVGIMPNQYLAGRHSTGTIGAIMSAAAGIKLTKLGPREAAMAFGIAASLSGGLRGAFGSMTKPFHSGAAAMNGILAVSLAKLGLTANQDTFERDNGYCVVTAGGKEQVHFDRIETALALESPTNYFLEPGLGVKMHPTGSAVFCGVDAVIDIIKEHPIKPEQVESISFGANPLTWDIHRWNGPGEPKTVEEAKYSIKYPLAVTLVDRRCGLKQLSMDRITDPVVRDLMEKVRIYAHPDLTDLSGYVYDLAAAHVTIKLKSGEEFTKFRRYARSYPGGEGITHDDLLDKYRECAEIVLPSDKVKRSIDLVEDLDKAPSINELISVVTSD